MLTGFNTDVEFNGRVFHVQTEDRGLDHPVVESLVYSGGLIVTARKTSYAEALATPEFKEADVLRVMETQHRELIREIRNGKFTKEPLKPFGHSLITNRGFEQVVLGFLLEQVPMQAIEVRAVSDRPGRFEVREPSTERPVVGASVVVDLLSQTGTATRLLEATTDERGSIEASLPEAAAGVLVCQAEALGQQATLRREIGAPEPEPSVRPA
jgi:hypothetical protein